MSRCNMDSLTKVYTVEFKDGNNLLCNNHIQAAYTIYKQLKYSYM